MRACSVCLHPEKSEIDDALTEGANLRTLAQRHGLSKSAMGRHKNNCLAPRIAAAARIVAPVKDTVRETRRIQAIATGQIVPSHLDIISLSGLVERLGRSLDRLDGAADDASSEGSHAALAALSAQLHRGIEVVARMQGLGDDPEPEKPRFSINIVLTPKAQS